MLSFCVRYKNNPEEIMRFRVSDADVRMFPQDRNGFHTFYHVRLSSHQLRRLDALRVAGALQATTNPDYVCWDDASMLLVDWDDAREVWELAW